MNAELPCEACLGTGGLELNGGRSLSNTYIECGVCDGTGEELAENEDQIKLYYEGIYTNDDADDEREGQEIVSYSLVSKKDYEKYCEDTKLEPCACDVQGCLSCFLDEYPHAPAIKEGGIPSYGSLWFESDTNAEN